MLTGAANVQGIGSGRCNSIPTITLVIAVDPVSVTIARAIRAFRLRIWICY